MLKATSQQKKKERVAFLLRGKQRRSFVCKKELERDL